MKHTLAALLLAASTLSFAAQAQTTPTPSVTPAENTVACKDGTNVPGPAHRGVCSGHGGQVTAARGGSTNTLAPVTAPSAAAAQGGGPGRVWVNTSSHVYHCEGDKFYGKTRRGQYMTETEAKAAGSHPAGGKACAA